MPKKITEYEEKREKSICYVRSLKGLSVAPGSSVPMPPGPVVVLVAPPVVVALPAASVMVALVTLPAVVALVTLPAVVILVALPAAPVIVALVALLPPSTVVVALRGAGPPMSAGWSPGTDSPLYSLSRPSSTPCALA